MHERRCDYFGCPGHQVRGPQDLIVIPVKERAKERHVRFFSSVDCILLYFASFPPGMLIGDIPNFLANKGTSATEPLITNDGFEDE